MLRQTSATALMNGKQDGWATLDAAVAIAKFVKLICIFLSNAKHVEWALLWVCVRTYIFTHITIYMYRCVCIEKGKRPVTCLFSWMLLICIASAIAARIFVSIAASASFVASLYMRCYLFLYWQHARFTSTFLLWSQLCFAYRLSAVFASLAAQRFAPPERWRDGAQQSSSCCISHLSFHLLFGVRPFWCADKCRRQLGKSNNEGAHTHTHADTAIVIYTNSCTFVVPHLRHSARRSLHSLHLIFACA